jgi:tetratricopeptide (TPR) repeat protein
MLKPRFFPFLTLALASFFVPIGVSAADNWIEVRSPHFTVDTNAGEKEARKIADQFEQIRQMFHGAFATMRVDPGQPVLIIAAKNENTMKLFLPEEWEAKGHIHHAGLYQPGEDKDYVVMRLDSEGENPFHTLYHEYTHALMRLNFTGLPLWLDEGLAEFFGNSTLGDKESKTGTIDPGHLYLLQQSKLIPIETLLEVDHQSPYYNENNRASIFYAESWALVHYLMMDKDARQQQLLKNFLNAWQKSGSQVQAAQEAFGDLKQFGRRIEDYARQQSFMVGLVKSGQQAAEKSYTARRVSLGEIAAIRGDFFVHHNRLEQARAVLQEAAQSEPNLAFAHEALSYYHYRQQQLSEADAEIKEALRLGATGFAPQYFHGMFLLQQGRMDKESAEEAMKSLEKAVQLNPQFAPAWEGLSQAYARFPELQKEAVNASIKAVQLDPGQHLYAINLTYLLINSGRYAEARTLAQRILAAAQSSGEKEVATNLLSNIQRAEAWAAQKQSLEAAAASRASDDSPGKNSVVIARPNGTSQPQPTSDPQVQLRHGSFAADGPVTSAECPSKAEILLKVNIGNGPVTFHAADMGKVSLAWADGTAEPSKDTCSQWKGRRVKVWFSPTPGKDYAGEIAALFFF